MKIDALKIAQAAKMASKSAGLMTTSQKNKALLAIAKFIKKYEKEILKENAKDVLTTEKAGLGPMVDRVLLNKERITGICSDIKNVVSLPDPVGKILSKRKQPSGLKIQQVSVPFGVILMIYESRPNVTVDAATLALKSGNAVILKGGKEAINSNRVIIKAIKAALKSVGVNENIVQFVDSVEKDSIADFLKMKSLIDVVIPRGGKGLINFVVENSSIPAINTGASVVHTYIDKKFDLKMAVAITVNAKTRRVSICNTLDTLLVHKDSAQKLLPILAKELAKHDVEIRADKRAHKILNEKYTKLKRATAQDFDTEFLDYILAIRVVDNLDEALTHIEKHSLRHSEAIITSDKKSAERFLNEVDAACVYVNATTQFTDGAQFGLGAEIGISTQKLHVRGPFALEGLTTYKWKIYGSGQCRK
ncbi:MAG: gamma-glutamyl phosphate reductase, glutamate-5-semialdehyde dehydrogenase [Candidatus Peregrinibacteria bacterium GW2011_GWC2_39_14]|nr:MAG: Gamma-glutamyl phosphate reductase [Candidatus Peregrinibacteria bacterium GW2011_GWA2_38_36]KKR05229.1 MAG: gamma-glutamyl phosphate reductase, glutamate-5-semialdehyde dehydrogenase [Candidatus Peregrinibacteria bacterium GW2011_GWC2_39_14]